MATEPMDTTTTSSSAAPSATAANITSTPSQPQPKRQKTSHSQSYTTKPTTLTSLTLRNPPWAYIHLQAVQHNPSQPTSPLDPVTVHLQLTQALHAFLGLHGAAIPIDILKLDTDADPSNVGGGRGGGQGGGLWIRVPSQDRAAVLAAVGGWVGKGGEAWRVLGWSSWGVGLGVRGGGGWLFE